MEHSELREEFPEDDWPEDTSELEPVDVRTSPTRTTQVIRPQLPLSSRGLETHLMMQEAHVFEEDEPVADEDLAMVPER